MKSNASGGWLISILLKIRQIISKSDSIVRSPEANINPNCLSIEDRLSGLTSSGQYDHLRLILSKNNNRSLWQKYLMISRSGFQMVKLIDIDYGENQICMALQDTCSGIIKNVHLDVNDPAFSFLLISWQEIREMMMPDRNTNQGSDDLLEFEF